jgi:hypothetical protein
MADLTDLIERAWGVLSRWAVPVMMTAAYALLVATSETDTTGKAWMAAGLLLVMIAWFTFRALADAAALSRALSVGDTERLLALADRGLAHRRARPPAVRARFLVARGLAHLLRGEFADARTALDAAAPAPDLQPLTATLRLIAQVELGLARSHGHADQRGEPGEHGSSNARERPAESGPQHVADDIGQFTHPGQRDARQTQNPSSVPAPRAPWLAWLADGIRAWRAGQLDAATSLLTRVTDDIRAGSALRAIAHLYAARIADARHDSVAAAGHRAAASDLAAPDAAWLRNA